jgi:hypothetical protein
VDSALELHTTLSSNAQELVDQLEAYKEKESGALKGMETMQSYSEKIDEITLVLQHCAQRKEELHQDKTKVTPNQKHPLC